MAYGELGNFVIKLNEPFHNDAPCAGTSAFLGVIPCRLDLIEGTNNALSMAGGGHNRFDHARNADFFDRTFEVVKVIYEFIRRGWQAQFFRG